MKTELSRLERRIRERFVKAFVTYRLLEDGDHVLVGLSGGKDSLCLLEMLAWRSKIDRPRFSVEAAHVRMENISYETSTDYLEQFCHDLDVPLHIVTTCFSHSLPSPSSPSPSSPSPSSSSSPSPSGFAYAEAPPRPSTLPSPSREKPVCFLCSWHRRKQLFNLAQTLGCNKIALGHHQDDLLHTALMNLFFQGRFGTMPARLQMKKMPLAIIRPLCLIEETDISRYAELRHYEKQVKLCPYEHDSQRTAMRHLYEELKTINHEVRYSMWNALAREGKLIEES